MSKRIHVEYRIDEESEWSRIQDIAYPENGYISLASLFNDISLGDDFWKPDYNHRIVAVPEKEKEILLSEEEVLE